MASESMSLAKDTRPRSPPLKSRISLNTSSPVNRKEAKVFRIWVLFMVGYVS